MAGGLFDAGPVFVLHAVTLAMTLLMGGDRGDVRVQTVWFLCLLPAWWLSGLVDVWSRQIFLKRYVVSVALAISLHAWLASLATVLDLGFGIYRFAWLLLIVTSGGLRQWKIASGATPSLEPWSRSTLRQWDVIVILAIVFFSVTVYRTPRSNDVPQFILQQQAMQADGSFRPSSIGMAAMGVDEAMPRWKSHLWHVVPVLIAEAGELPVRPVIERWLPIPLAVTVLVCLATIVRDLTHRPATLSVAAAAVLGPILLWHRSYNAFVYSFRITNNFALDKDFCLFLLIPTLVWLAVRWIRGHHASGFLALALSPAVLKFHPMTAVYLLLLSAPIVVATWPKGSRFRGPDARRVIAVTVVSLAWFVAVVWIGDAQGFHKQIREVLSLDFAAAAEQGRPLHYWVGHYASFPDVEAVSGWQLDTTAWTRGRLHLRPGLIVGCGLMVSAHAATVLWGWMLWRRPNRASDRRRFRGVVTCWVMLWGIVLVSPLVLTWKPHWLGGLERLHWFAILPSLIAVASAIGYLTGRRAAKALFAFGLVLVVAYAGISFHLGSTTVLTKVRGLENLLDFEIERIWRAKRDYRFEDAKVPLARGKPAWLRDDDRVLLLDTAGTSDYHLMRQGVYWSEPYAEAMALARRGDEFLRDRQFFYDLLDRRIGAGRQADLERWLRDRGITVIVDRRPGAEHFLSRLTLRFDASGSAARGVFRLR